MASETTLGPHVLAWLESQHYDCYQEVKTHGGKTADIIGITSDPFQLVVVELKTSLSFDVIVQAMGWRHTAMRVYAAVPYANRRSDGRWLAERTCEANGIGLLEVRPFHGYNGQTVVTEIVRAPLHRLSRVNAVKLAATLAVEHKTTCDAGSTGGAARWTPWLKTMLAVARVVVANPGITVKDLMPQIEHHYHSPSTAKASIVKWVSKGKAPGVTVRREGRELRLYCDIEVLKAKEKKLRLTGSYE